MSGLVQKYQPDPVPTAGENLGEFLRRELDRIALAMRSRDEVVTGGATLSAGTVTVTFAREQPDTEYKILLSINQTTSYVSWASKATTGFVINSDHATATVQWAIFRDRDND